MKRLILSISMLLLAMPTARADDVRVAVANNFYGPAKVLAQDYYQFSGEQLILSTGSTGQLYAQITNGAPYDVFLAADMARPEKLVESELASEAFTYASGRLVLWSSDESLFSDNISAIGGIIVLEDKRIQHLALANPKLAPYGVAAEQTIKKLGLYSDLKPKLVEGKNLSVVYQFVTTDNAQAGFLSMSQIYKDGDFIEGSHWVIPNDMYSPIDQGAVLLKSASDTDLSMSFIRYLKSDRAKAIIARYGYL